MNNKYLAWIHKHPIWSVLIIFFAIGLISSSTKKTQVQNIQTQQSEVKQEVKEVEVQQQPLTFQDKIKAVVKEKSTAATAMSFVSIENYSGLRNVKVNVDKYYKPESLYRNTGVLSAEIFKESFADDTNISDTIVWFYGDITDKYGNVSNKAVLSYAISRSIFEKINWQNFDASNLCDFLKSEYRSSNGEANCSTNVSLQ